MRIGRTIRAVLLGAVALFASVSWAGATPKPEVVIANPDTKCVADAATMRREHMNRLKHKRDVTMREGIRGGKDGLNACIDCHASKTDGSVLGSDKNFCQTCHSYTAVRLDCFECHQAKPSRVAASLTPAPAPAPVAVKTETPKEGVR